MTWQYDGYSSICPRCKTEFKALIVFDIAEITLKPNAFGFCPICGTPNSSARKDNRISAYKRLRHSIFADQCKACAVRKGCSSEQLSCPTCFAREAGDKCACDSYATIPEIYTGKCNFYFNLDKEEKII